MLKQDYDTSNFEINRSLPNGKNKKVIGLIKDELGGKMFNFIPNRSETPYHPYKILIIGVYGSGKTNALLNLI